MEIVEITIDGNTFVAMDTDYEGIVNTTVLEANLYGKTEFMRHKFFHQFTEDGPEPLSRELMTKILTTHEDN